MVVLVVLRVGPRPIQVVAMAAWLDLIVLVRLALMAFKSLRLLPAFPQQLIITMAVVAVVVLVT
jgi:hypothetical protein